MRSQLILKGSTGLPRLTGKIALRVRFELTRCDAPLVFMSKISDLKTSAVGRLATSAHLHSIMPMPFKPNDVQMHPIPQFLLHRAAISIILIFISSLIAAYADQRSLASAVRRSSERPRHPDRGEQDIKDWSRPQG